MALALGYFATKGETKQEIGELLRLHTNSSLVEQIYDNLIDGANEKYNMSIVNKIWLRKSFNVRPEFQDVARKSFNSEVSNVDFDDLDGTIGEINNWIDKATHHKITKAVSKDCLNKDTLMVLLNAVYFKGKWQEPFKSWKTLGKFWNHGQTMINTKVMKCNRVVLYAELNELNAVAAEIPYNVEGLSMLILLPIEANGLQDMERKLASLDLLELVKHRLHPSRRIVILPKFTVKSDFDLVDVLSKLGVQKIFTDTADFSGLLSDSENAKVSTAKHTAFIDVNQDGTEAAASTSEFFLLLLAFHC